MAVSPPPMTATRLPTSTGFRIRLRQLLRRHVGADQEVHRPVDAGELVARDFVVAVEPLARDRQRRLFRGAVAEEDGVEAAVEEAVDGHVLADDGVGLELDAEFRQERDLLVDNRLVHLEAWDAVEEQTSRLRPGVEDGAGVALLRQLLGDGQARRPGADDGHPLAGRRRQVRDGPAAVLSLIVGDEHLDAADGDRPRVLGEDAVPFALAFLGAEAGADLGHGARLAQLGDRAADVAAFEQSEVNRDLIVERAGLAAGRRRALDAAHRLLPRRFGVPREIRFFPVPDADLGRSLDDRLGRQLQAGLAVEGRLLLLCHERFLPGSVMEPSPLA